jgi:hypothetical protein
MARALNDKFPIAAANLFSAHTGWHATHPFLT